MVKKKETFLKFIIIEKAVIGLAEVAIAAWLLTLVGSDIEKVALDLTRFFNLEPGNHYEVALVKRFGTSGDGALYALSLGSFLVGVLLLVEGYGLHLRLRWAEWLTVVTTSLFIPFELVWTVQDPTLTSAGTLVLNSAIVYYLAKHKELFGTKKHPPRESSDQTGPDS